MLAEKNKPDMQFVFSLLSVILFVAGIIYAFDDMNQSRGVIFMIGTLICQQWKKEIK